MQSKAPPERSQSLPACCVSEAVEEDPEPSELSPCGDVCQTARALAERVQLLGLSHAGGCAGSLHRAMCLQGFSFQCC